MKKYKFESLTQRDIDKLCSRENLDSKNVSSSVREIQEQVLNRWDDAIRELTEKFDWVRLKNFLVWEEEFIEAESLVSDKLKESIKTAYANIHKFHKIQFERQTKDIHERIETSTWVFWWSEFRSIENVGLYIPWGTAPLFSTIYMLGASAKIAWCENICLYTPPNKQWKIHPAMLYTAKLLWIDKIYKIGWAQSIFAMAYWTKQVPRVDKIFGPWNQYVTTAKTLVSQVVAIDMPAGPSEVLVIADKESNAMFVAADLLSQAEHWEDSQVVLLSTSESKVDEIMTQIQIQLKGLERSETAKACLEKSFAVICSSIEQKIKFTNRYAPEHLIISNESWREIIPKIQNAWSVFCWKYSAESFWDYAAWPNHALPTSWFARSYSWVSAINFWKIITFEEVTKEWLINLWPVVEQLAKAEQLDAHAAAASIRLKNI